jgi:hypothetical protein
VRFQISNCRFEISEAKISEAKILEAKASEAKRISRAEK